jgi:hypothetical protein
MKTLFFSILMLSQIILAKPIEINADEKIIWTHPTPTLEATVISTGDDKGLLYLTMDYVSEKTTLELNALKVQYPGFEINIIQAEQAGLATIKIGSILNTNLPMMQGQVGPLINTSLELNAQQMKFILQNKTSLKSLIEVLAPVKFKYLKNQVVESYSVKSDFCSSFNATSVHDLILNFSDFKKPAGIQYDQTFQSLQEQLLDHCFNLNANPVQSFHDLLTLKITSTTSADPITGIYKQRVENIVNQNLNPDIDLEIQ